MYAMVERKKHIDMIIFIRNSMKKNIRVIVATIIMLSTTHITFSILLPENTTSKKHKPQYNDTQIRMCRTVMSITEDKWNKMNSAERERAMRLSYFYRGLL